MSPLAYCTGNGPIFASTNESATGWKPGAEFIDGRDDPDPVALAEGFDTVFRYYAALEDLDASYRYGRYVAVLALPAALAHHFEAASGRMDRTKVIVLQMLNMAVILRRYTTPEASWRRRYRATLGRRLFAEALKELLTGRWNFPQARGAMLAIRRWREVWAMPIEAIDEMYPALQKRLIEARS